MSLLNDIFTKKSSNFIKIQQQPEFPLKYDKIYGPYTPITSIEKSYQKDFINLLLTSPGEWPMSPEMGVGLKHYIFEFENTEKINSLQPAIQNQITKFLPQIRLFNVEIIRNDIERDKNKAKLIIQYSILDSVGFSTEFILNMVSNAVQIEDIFSKQVQSLDLLNRSIGVISSTVSA